MTAIPARLSKRGREWEDAATIQGRPYRRITRARVVCGGNCPGDLGIWSLDAERTGYGYLWLPPHGYHRVAATSRTWRPSRRDQVRGELSKFVPERPDIYRRRYRTSAGWDGWGDMEGECPECHQLNNVSREAFISHEPDLRTAFWGVVSPTVWEEPPSPRRPRKVGGHDPNRD